MEKILNQEEIDAMVRAARAGKIPDAAMPAQPRAEPWDVRRAGQIGREQLQAITQLHEAFARNLTHALGAYLQIVFAATLVSAEHLTYRELLQRIPETTYLASCRVDPMGVNAALQLDLKVAFPIIDLLLGGDGKSLAGTRELTEIEEQILNSVARIICRELGVAWQALELEIVFEERIGVGAAQRLMAPGEKNLSLSFEITMPDVRGGLNFAIPATVSNALLRKISVAWMRRPTPAAADFRKRLMRRLLDCPFTAELGAMNVRASMASLSHLKPGHILAFARKADEPASLLVEGREMFSATPARHGTIRAARLLERIPDSPDRVTGEERPK
jgi:flagellar motor switch protein FliM